MNEAGHIWVGTDISQDMLSVGVDRGTEGDMMLHDMGQGLPFRHGIFDAVISISALQWLCYSHKKCDVYVKDACTLCCLCPTTNASLVILHNPFTPFFLFLFFENACSAPICT